VNNEVAWPNPSNAKGLDWKQSDWAALQIESSLDFAHGDFWTTFLCGSLNYQAVHHLFPHISQWYYPEMAPIVREVCAEFGVRYNLKESIWGMIKAHIDRIAMFGDEELVLR
jgi:fatty acid desaturase